MQPTDNINNPEGMDELLKQAFLDLDMSKTEDSRLMDEMAAQVLSKDWPLAGDQSKNAKSKTSVSAGKTWIWILSGVAALSGLTIAAFILFNNDTPDKALSETKAETATPFSKHEEQAIVTLAENKAEVTSENNNTLAVKKNGNIALPKKQYVSRGNVPKLLPGDLRVENTADKTITNNPNDNSAINNHTLKNNITLEVTPDAANPIPKIIGTDTLEKTVENKEEVKARPLLSAEEMEKHKKDMQKMEDDSFTGMKLSDYSKITVDAKRSALQNGFFLKKTEVTIKEYKLFLTDLLANGKASEYEIAKPKLDNIWKDPKDKTNRAFLEMYFKKPKFENYPVVCISPEGMEMYCKWLEGKIENYYKRSNEKFKISVNLPQIDQWKYVATEGRRTHKYGTANGKLKEHWWLGLGKNWTANFIETQGKFVANDDSLAVEDTGKKKDGPNAVRRVTKNQFTAYAKTYPSVMNDVYNMSGNVSEVVTYSVDAKSTKYRSIGGNWNSTADFLKVEAEDEFNGSLQPSPYIGFRPVIVMEVPQGKK
jgi:formylglycine-generating enzyme required for sulfatase activity